MATTSRQRDVAQDGDAKRDHHPATRPSRWQLTVGVAGLVAVLWAGNNLYEAIDRGSVGRGGDGGHGPPSGVPITQPPGEGRQGPASGTGGEHQAPSSGTGGSHDPSRFGHR